ncbi:putative ATPase [Gordonia hirsuta DSM 44140 = NBRC 16056]|uniref:Putative ATPase n=1 Tax=Gordonia hirsuta DSM 44140 = NBRC 16056 TaxID=1121927 RepID=L7L9H9_9ACTN|nr:AAA family ATPase [Gordonia hirsuta]GAC56688.1 putative ATPase [Gordonia hirsuta DSM 44140 = NBRC 16056]
MTAADDYPTDRNDDGQELSDVAGLFADLGLTTICDPPESTALRGTRTVAPAARVHRLDQSRDVAAALLRPSAGIVVVTGSPGSGRTGFLAEVAAALAAAEDAPVLRLVEPDKDADPVAVANHLVVSGREGAEVLVFDDFEHRARLHADDRGTGLLSQVVLCNQTFGLRFLLVLDESMLSRLAELEPALARTQHTVALGEFPATALAGAVRPVVTALVRRNGLDLDDEVITAALRPAGPTESYRHPGLAIARIDAAIGRARATRAPAVLLEHLGLSCGGLSGGAGAAGLAAALSRSVRGQDPAVAAVADCLAPALSGLKLRPERPHAVLLFAGPTGVGKTELATRLAAAAYGSDDALIRLDMSEYAEAADARAKLIGHHRSWRNSSTAGLLTTRVIGRPRCVVLLDEFEKSAPELWPLFLQVFDEGRLTDGWGQTASFSETIIILTTNLGVREGARRSAGFGAPEGFSAARQHAAIAATFPPEFAGRLTEIICFAPLDLAAVRQIAELELARTATRLAGQGWRIEYDEAVVHRLAEDGYDPAYGARHLQRNIERKFLSLLAGARSRQVRVRAEDSRLQAESLA